MSTEADYHSIPGPSFLEPQETAAELLARTFVAPLRSGVPVIDQHTALRPGHILELVGGPATAKSELLLQTAVSCVLSRRNGSPAEQCLLLDLSGKFDIVRLMAVLEDRVTAQQPRDAPRDGPASLVAESLAINAALARLHLVGCSAANAKVQCHNSMELLAALTSVPAICALNPGLGAFRLLLIDDISAFHWLDIGYRGDEPGSMSSDGVRGGLQRIHSAMAAMIRKVAMQHRLVVIIARSTALPELCRPLAELPTHRMTMSRRVDADGIQFVAQWQAASAIPQAFMVQDGHIERTQ